LRRSSTSSTAASLLDIVKRSEERHGLSSNLIAVIGVQVEELAPGVSRTSDFGYAPLESGLIAAIVVAHQLALLVGEERAGMFACTAVGEVVDRGRAAH